MRKKWRKLGLLYRPSDHGQHPKLLSHAANPLPIFIDEDVYRIFFCGRDSDNRSSVGAVDIDIVRRKIIRVHYQPFFEHGPKGSFYAEGVSIGNCYEVDGIKYMLFMGWQNPEGDHWRGDIGRLVVQPDLSLKLEDEIPLMTPDETDSLSLSYPWVMKSAMNDYIMWYGVTKTWDAGNGEMLHVINYATSTDGQRWARKGLAIPYKIGKAQAFSRPTVIASSEMGYEMWFSYRSGNGTTYRLGYAFSDDRRQWKVELDGTGIDISESGWDSEMIEYPFVFNHKGKRYMLYNGNGYGRTGFGLAILETKGSC